MARRTKDDEPRFVVTMRLYPEKWQEDILNKRFKIMEHLKNDLIRLEKRKLDNLKRTAVWNELESQIAEAYKNTKNQEGKAKEDKPKGKTKKGKAKKGKEKENRELDLLKKKKRALLEQAGISNNQFEKDITPMQHHFAYHIASQVSHKASNEVWEAFEKVLFGSGEKVSYIKKETLSSVGTKTQSMRLKSGCFVWAGGEVVDNRGKNVVLSTLSLRMQQPKTEYELNAFRCPIATYRVLRRWYGSKYNWYVQITFKGTPPVKQNRMVGLGRVGLDIGTSSIAIVSENEAKLLELAPQVDKTYAQKVQIQRKMDRSRRAMNPENYNADGTIRRGVKLTHNESNRYKRLAGRMRELSRREAAQRKHQHILLANEILSLGGEIYVEQMNFAALQHRAKKTEISEKTGRYKKKKRFGKSLANKAPAMLISLLGNKLKALTGGGIIEIDTWEYKASQYDHTDDQYHKKTLSQRRMTLSNGDVLQRDLYSAWLIMNADETLTRPDEARCLRTYDQFKALHDQEIERIRHSEKKLSSFGY